MHVSGDALVREAARLAAEAQAARRPRETLLWLRVASEADRMSDSIDRALVGRDPADAFRTVYMRGLAAGMAELGEGAEETGAAPG